MTHLHLAGDSLADAVATAVAVRVFGADVRRLARRVLAAGVRAGTTELVRSRARSAREENQ
jgi:hypothetical protein